MVYRRREKNVLLPGRRNFGQGSDGNSSSRSIPLSLGPDTDLDAIMQAFRELPRYFGIKPGFIREAVTNLLPDFAAARNFRTLVTTASEAFRAAEASASVSARALSRFCEMLCSKAPPIFERLALMLRVCPFRELCRQDKS